jgi:SAM-dependent methyltransferase
LIFTHSDYLPVPDVEREEYDTHQNSPSDSGYRNFLSQAMNPLMKFLSPGDQGLDYGSGPGPTLHLMLQEQGYRMDIYDPFFHPDDAVFNKKYDFITCTEVAEHMHDPLNDLNKVFSLLKKGGYLCVMTKLFNPGDDFTVWRYKDDRTHVVFYSEYTFKWLAEQWKAPVSFYAGNVMIFKKAAG